LKGQIAFDAGLILPPACGRPRKREDARGVVYGSKETKDVHAGVKAEAVRLTQAPGATVLAPIEN
jgi:hypothetical protein